MDMMILQIPPGPERTVEYQSLQRVTVLESALTDLLLGPGEGEPLQLPEIAEKAFLPTLFMPGRIRMLVVMSR